TRYWQVEGQYEETLPQPRSYAQEDRRYTQDEGQYRKTLPPPRRYTQEDQRFTQEDGNYREPAYSDEYRGEVYGGDVYYEEPSVYEYYPRREYRYYGTPDFGYSEYGRERSVRVGPVQVFWNR
ncbi:MAG TPA: hypothetical protein VHK01_02365, partial [Lacipirellulaceae bacterium]|nr:hypothetical protein [Lacipirellulaceae bacterium]